MEIRTHSGVEIETDMGQGVVYLDLTDSGAEERFHCRLLPSEARILAQVLVEEASACDQQIEASKSKGRQ